MREEFLKIFLLICKFDKNKVEFFDRHNPQNLKNRGFLPDTNYKAFTFFLTLIKKKILNLFLVKCLQKIELKKRTQKNIEFFLIF